MSGPEPDPWDRMADQWKSLGRKLRDTYRQSADETGPSEEDVKAAFRTLGSAWDRLTDAFGTAVRDEEVRGNVRKAATGFFEAVGSALSELGSELRRSKSEETGDIEGKRAQPDESGPPASEHTSREPLK